MEQFYEEEFFNVMSQTYDKMKQTIKQNQDTIKTQLLEEINFALTKIEHLQNEGKLGEVGFITFVFLRTRFLEKNYTYAIYAYEKEKYAGNEAYVGEINTKHCLQCYEQAEKELKKSAKKYFGSISDRDVERLILEETTRSIYYMQNLFRIWKKEIIDLESYQRIQKAEYFRLELGEYYEPGIGIIVDEKSRNDRMIKRKLKKETNHCCQNLSNLNLEGMQYIAKEFVDADFQGSNLRNTKWINCAMQGSDFQRATLIQGYFYQCSLQESVWRQTDVRETIFEECLMYAGEKICLKSFWPDYEKIEAENCKLDNVVFKKCILNKMDFSRLDISKCRLEDCVIEDCVFTKEQIEQHKFDINGWKLKVV